MSPRTLFSDEPRFAVSTRLKGGGISLPCITISNPDFAFWMRIYLNPKNRFF
jgi:hypothetical protein